MPLINQMTRQAVLDDYAQHFSELLAWTSWCYSQHPLLQHQLGIFNSQVGVQQGDPLGPYLFALVLQRIVNMIYIDEECGDLSHNAWYLDDGKLAGKSASVLRALNIVSSALGFNINLKKCELYGAGDLSSFPSAIQTSNTHHLELLGAPIGDSEYCNQFISRKHQAALALLSTLEEIGSLDPKVALALLRLCSGF